MQSEISQTEKNKYCMISLTYGFLKNKNKTKTKPTDTKNRLVAARGTNFQL